MDFVLIGAGLGSLLLVLRAAIGRFRPPLTGPAVGRMPEADWRRRMAQDRSLRMAARMLGLAGSCLLLVLATLILAGVSDPAGMTVILATALALGMGCGYWTFLFRAPDWRVFLPPLFGPGRAVARRAPGPDRGRTLGSRSAPVRATDAGGVSERRRASTPAPSRSRSPTMANDSRQLATDQSADLATAAAPIARIPTDRAEPSDWPTRWGQALDQDVANPTRRVPDPSPSSAPRQR